LELNLLISSDANYLPHAATALTSVCEHNRQHAITIYYLHAGLAAIDIAHLSAHFERYGARVEFIVADDARLRQFKTRAHFTTPTYYRILCADLLPRSADRVLYIDCDVIVRADVADIYAADLGGCPVAAVRDAYVGDAPWCHQLNALVGAAMHDYFNSGVLVIDLERYRSAGIGPAALELLDRHHADFTYADQDALNVVLARQWKPLPARWNVQSLWYALDFCIRSTTFAPEWRLEFVNAVMNPAIIHYASPSKPWQFMNVHPLKREYWKYRQLSPYATG
jgi:lipopolysaccharide biosynthesis glycosyltransferase